MLHDWALGHQWLCWEHSCLRTVGINRPYNRQRSAWGVSKWRWRRSPWKGIRYRVVGSRDLACRFDDCSYGYSTHKWWQTLLLGLWCSFAIIGRWGRFQKTIGPWGCLLSALRRAEHDLKEVWAVLLKQATTYRHQNWSIEAAQAVDWECKVDRISQANSELKDRWVCCQVPSKADEEVGGCW